jgi:hypothetical protein
MVKNGKKWQKKLSTRSSDVVTHRRTNQARTGLTSLS